MRRGLLIIGLVVLVGGLVMAAVSPGLEKPYIKTYSTFTGYSLGEYVSPPIHVSGEAEISVLGSESYLVKSSELMNVTPSDISAYSLPMALNLTVNGEVTHSFVVGTGNYTVVSFATDIYGLSYTVISDYSLVSFLGTLFVIGLVLILAGIVLTGLGAVLKPRMASVA